MGITNRITANLFREPAGGRWALVAAASGLLMVGFVTGSVVFSGSWLDPRFALLGGGFVAMGTAERLPTPRLRSAGILRVCAICLFFTFGSVSIVTGLLDAAG
jgi:hypothetical protein